MRAILIAAATLAFAVPAAAQSTAVDTCAMLTMDQSERPLSSSGGSNCLVDSKVGGVDIRYRLYRSNYAQACASLDDRRKTEFDPDVAVGEWSAGPDLPKPTQSFRKLNGDHSHRQPEVPGQPIVIQIHPAYYLVAFCHVDYYFDGWALYSTPKAPAVPDAVRLAIDQRAENTLRRILGGGVLNTVDAEREFLQTLGVDFQNLVPTLQMVNGGMNPSRWSKDVMTGKEATDAEATLRKRLPKPLSEEDEKRLSGAITAIKRAAGLGASLDLKGGLAFPASGANIGVLINLTVRAATSTDPVEAHEAATAAARYGAMLFDFDMRALRDRNAAGSPVP